MSNTRAWDFFVSETLNRLSTDLAAGQITLRLDERGERYVVEGPTESGRDIVVPTSSRALLVPPRLPQRVSPWGLLSPFFITDTRLKLRTQVPWSAIRRDYNVSIATANDASSESIVVLRLRGQSGDAVFGWYVRFESSPRRLVRVSADVCQRLIDAMRHDDKLVGSSLVNRYTDVGVYHDASGLAFNALAVDRFITYKKRIALATSVIGHKRGRACDKPTPTPTPVQSDATTCVICLEDHTTAIQRCRHDSCRTHVCFDCHSHCRGLCPVCDRSAINSDYPCSKCNTLVPLSKYGYPCVACQSNCLCKGCYKVYGECGSCETDVLTN